MNAPPPSQQASGRESVAGSDSLRRCVGDPSAFLQRDWTRRVHHRPGGDFTDLLSLDDVDHILSNTALRLPSFRLVRDGSTVDPRSYTRQARIGSRTVTDLADPARVYAEFDAGATMVLQGLHRSWPALTAFCRDLERVLTHPVQANAYLTPPTSAGLRVHRDAHDVFALQTFGRKQWVLYEDDAPTPSLDLSLAPGDALYVPRGIRHAARTVDSPSLHITIGVRTTTFGDLLRRIADEAAREPWADVALPAGYADHPDAVAADVERSLAEFARWVVARDPRTIASDAAQRFRGARPRLLRGHLRSLVALDEVDVDTTVVLRADVLPDISTDDGRLVVTLPDKTLRLPAHTEAAVIRLCTGAPVRVGALPGMYDEESRLVLVRRFVREGLLELVCG